MNALQTTLSQHNPANFAPIAKALLRETQAKLAAREAQVAELMTACAQDRSLIAALKIVLSPVRELPVELLVAILSDVVHEEKEDGLSAVLRLSQVCGHWRQLVQRTPSLWTVELPIRPKDTPEYLSLLRIFIERSAPLAIPINMVVHRPWVSTAAGSTANFPSAVCELLLDAAGRWGSFSVKHAPEILSMLSKRSVRRLTLLKSVTLQNDVIHPQAPAGGNFFLDAPLLVEADINLAHSGEFTMPWCQLTDLTLFEPDDALGILSLCTNLKNLVLTFPGFSLPPVGPAVPAVLPNLDQFTLYSDIGHSDSSSQALAPFFARLAFPALKYLRIVMESQHGDDGPTPYTEEFRQFLSRITALETLRIEASELGTEEFLTIVRHTPALRTLHLERCHTWVEPRVLHELSWGFDAGAGADAASQLLPKLKEISLNFVVLNERDVKALMDVVRSRWWADGDGPAAGAPTRLECVHVVGPDVEDHDIHRWDEVVRQLREEGLCIELKFDW